MINSMVSSLIYSRRRTIIEVFPRKLKELWKEWDLRVTVLLSLTLQIVLIMTAGRRKYNHKLWIRMVVWSAYLAADAVATFALGMISNDITEIYDDNARCTEHAKIELTAFWAPFLLLHLGGPDTITAYALEDNDLWLRHFLGLILQTGIAVYVILMAWTGSRLSIMSILMFFAGLIKYGERTWALWSASNELKENKSGMWLSDDFMRDAFVEEEKNKNEEGYFVGADTSNTLADLSVLNSNTVSEKDKLEAAMNLEYLTLRFLLDSTLGSSVKERTYFLFRNLSFENAFRVTDLGLGLAYDYFYTKLPLLDCYPLLALPLRLITIILTCIVLVLLAFLDHKHKYPKVDLSITFLLLVVAVILEIYSALLLLSADRFLTFSSKISNCFSPSRSPRWSNTMPQFSILRVAMQEKPPTCAIIFEPIFRNHKYLENEIRPVPEELKRWIFQHLKEKANVANSTGESQRRNEISSTVLSDAGGPKAGDGTIPEPPKFEENPSKSILFWHIVTESSYHLDGVQLDENCQLINQISRYLMYLLVMHPTMLPLGISKMNIDVPGMMFSFESTYMPREKIEALKKFVWDSSYDANPREVNSLYQPEEKSLREVLHGARLYIRRMKESEKDLREKWNKLRSTWLEILTNAASKCRGREHARQLRHGGEFLTHVWLLMAYFGLTGHFPITERPEIARLIAR